MESQKRKIIITESQIIDISHEEWLAKLTEKYENLNRE
jgi:hypothetical protein